MLLKHRKKNYTLTSILLLTVNMKILVNKHKYLMNFKFITHIPSNFNSLSHKNVATSLPASSLPARLVSSCERQSISRCQYLQLPFLINNWMLLWCCKEHICIISQKKFHTISFHIGTLIKGKICCDMEKKELVSFWYIMRTKIGPFYKLPNEESDLISWFWVTL